MSRSSSQLRKDKIERARARIAEGTYEAAVNWNGIFTSRLLDTLLLDLNSCPVGAGNQYRDSVADLLSGFLHEVVDVPLVRTEFPCHGSRGDIELPLRLEVLSAYPLWHFWSQKYQATSILVEVKNEKRKTDCGSVQQIDSYLNLASRGKLGFLISRNGFTKNAINQLTQIASLGNNLIIPFSHQDMIEVSRARRDGCSAVMEYVRRKQNLLLQRNH